LIASRAQSGLPFLIVTLIGFALALVGLGVDSPPLATGGLAVAVLGTMTVARLVSGAFSSLAFLFSFFAGLYALSGPVQVVLDQELPPSFGESFATAEICVLTALSLVGFALGLLAVGGRCRITPERGRPWFRSYSPREMVRIGIVLASAAAFMELVNFLRVGGMAAFVLGKADYQTLVSDLSLTLPGFKVLHLAVAFFGLGLGPWVRERTRTDGLGNNLVLFALISAFPVMIAAGLGRRGVLLGLVLVGFLAFFWGHPLRAIRKRYLVAAFVLYLGMAFLYSARPLVGYSLATGDWGYFWSHVFEEQRLKHALNPGTSEFGAPFGNLAVYLREGNDRPYWGQTYLNGLAVLVPGFAYPGRKPKQINYVFRDRYFQYQSIKGGIAGPGFSSVLEAYMNFRYAGVLVIPLVVGVVLALLDKYRVRFGPTGAVVYCILGPLAQSWHRSQFGFVAGNIFISVVLLLLFSAGLEALVMIRDATFRRWSTS